MNNSEVAQVVAVVLEQLGLTAGEMSQRQAKKVYGGYFVELVKAERITPVHTEKGHAGTKFYRVADILACKAEDTRKAQLLNTHTL